MRHSDCFTALQALLPSLTPSLSQGEVEAMRVGSESASVSLSFDLRRPLVGDGWGEALRGVLIVLVFLLLTACTQADIHHLPETSPEGMVQIFPDMSDHTLPAVQYHFYPAGGDAECIVCGCDGSGNFEGKLPVGAYRVIATNTSASNVEFTGMDAYESATVYARSLVAARMALGRDASSFNYLEQPANIYSTVVEELVVTAGGVVRKEPSPVLLTRCLSLVFSLQSDLAGEVVAMSGVLPGVYPAMQLCSGRGVQIEQSPGLAVRFGTEGSGSERKAQIFLFGLRDPGYGQAYTNRLELELTLADGSSVHTGLDLTDILSEMIEKNDGSLPLDVSIPIEVEKTDIGIGVEVGEWVYEGEGGVIEN